MAKSHMHVLPNGFTLSFNINFETVGCCGACYLSFSCRAYKDGEGTYKTLKEIKMTSDEVMYIFFKWWMPQVRSSSPLNWSAFGGRGFTFVVMTDNAHLDSGGGRIACTRTFAEYLAKRQDTYGKIIESSWRNSMKYYQPSQINNGVYNRRTNYADHLIKAWIWEPAKNINDNVVMYSWPTIEAAEAV